MKTLIAIVLAVVTYLALGTVLPFLNHTALVVVILGSLGAMTYKFLLACAVFGYVSGR
jgi:hypothetical protein